VPLSVFEHSHIVSQALVSVASVAPLFPPYFDMALLLDCCLQIQQNAHMALLKHFLELKRTSNLAQLHIVKASREYCSRLLSLVQASYERLSYEKSSNFTSTKRRGIYICISILLKTLRTLQTKSMCFIDENFLHNLTSFHRSAHRICTRDCKKEAVGVACLI